MVDKDQAEKAWEDSLKHPTRERPLPESVKPGKCEVCGQDLPTVLDAMFHLREVHQIQEPDVTFKPRAE